jgi:ribonuclease P protein component
MAFESAWPRRVGEKSSTLDAKSAARASSSPPRERATISSRIAKSKPRLRFGSDARIKTRRDFLRIQAQGRKLHLRHFLILVSAHKLGQSARSRVGLVITTKIDKRSVNRNRLKRRIREVVRVNQHRLSPGFDFVIVARKDATLCELKDVRAEIVTALERAGYLSRESQ